MIYCTYQKVNPLIHKIRMRPDVHICLHPLQTQRFKGGGQSVTILAWSKISAILSPYISNPQLHLHFGGRRQKLGQMSKVVNSLEAKAKVRSRAVYLNNERFSTVEPILRSFGWEKYRYIEHNIPHHLQFRLRNMVQRLQLLKNWRSHEKRLWEPDSIFAIENTRCLMRDLLVDPK